jgi:hypothetical protein
MIGPDRFSRVTAEARVPEQVVSYVCAVAEARPRRLGACIGYESPERLLLVGYPLHDPLDEAAMADAVAEALGTPGLRRITVIGPARPPQAPAACEAIKDAYHGLALPAPAPRPKLASLLRRAGRELVLEFGRSLGAEHRAIIGRYLEAGGLAHGTRKIFGELPRYLEASGGSLVASARRRAGDLAAFGVGEYSALETAFFMFCFRDPSAPPGSSDLVLAGLLEQAERRGQARMNLGLGVNAGIRFFKRKWGAEAELPYVEVSWGISAGKDEDNPGLWRRLRRRGAP